jgi:predicted nuclease with TOPRIM domain
MDNVLNEKIQNAYLDSVLMHKAHEYLCALDVVERLNAKLDEKWEEKVDIKSTGEYKDKSVKELKAMLDSLEGEKPFNREKYSEIMFAIRSKTGWERGEGQ